MIIATGPMARFLPTTDASQSSGYTNLFHLCQSVASFIFK